MDTPASSVNLIDDSIISDAPKQCVSEDAALDAAARMGNSHLATLMTEPDTSNGQDVVKEPIKQDNHFECMPTNSSMENVTKLQLIGQSNLNNNNHHQSQESNIKLKRCKHGRIIIKDLSKKKLLHNENSSANDLDREKKSNDLDCRVETDYQQLDVTADSVTTEQSVGSPADKCFTSPAPTKSPRETSPSPQSPEGLPKQLLSPPIDETISIAVKQKINQKQSKSSNEFSRGSHRHQNTNRSRRSRSNSGSRSRTRSRSLSRGRGRSPSPRRRSRYSRSPSPRMATSNRDRAKSPYRYDSRSPRRQAKSPSTRGTNRRSSRRKNRYRSNNYRDEPSRSRSPRRRRTSRSHSRSSSSREKEFTSSNRVRREESRSPSRQQYRNDRYSSHDRHSRRKETYVDRKSSSKLTRDDCKLRTDTLDSGVSDNFNSASNQHTSNEIQSTTKPIESSGNVGHLHPRRPQTSLNISSQVFNAKPIPPEISTVTKDATSPRDLSTARSPATPSNDSVSSDIYDPEGPVMLISPGDSPPLSPVNNAAFSKELYQPNNDKNGDDDVPSSAVQLNQQEKYLQKLNRQERVIEEVKMSLRPYYQNRTIDKEQYKDVLRRAVPKICHSKKGEINPNKIRTLVDAYVKKMKHHRD